MKCKKLILLMAVILIFSLATPAFAVSAQTRVTATVSLPDVKIEVVVPSSTRTYLNPKSLPVKVGGVISDNSIVSDVAYIENKSAVPISVSASVTGAVKSGSDLMLSSATFDADTITQKKAFLYLDMEAMTDPSDTDWWETWFGNIAYDAEKHLVITTATKTKKDIVTLAAYDEENADAAVKRFGAFRVTGVCSAEPKNEWNAKDGLTTTITFTFKALPVSTIVE